MISMKNHELDQKIKSLAQQEREVLSEVIKYIGEADARRIYLDFAYPSLFAYLVEACGYSEGAAQRRIDAARLLKDEPQVAEKIETGEINLSQVTMLQRAIREKNKTRKVTAEEKQNLISKISNKSSQETQQLIARELDVALKENPKTTFQKDESVRLEISLTKAQWQKLERARELASNATHSNDWAVLLEYLAEKLIRQKEGPAATAAVTAAVKKQVLRRDKSCQYLDKLTGKICGSRWQAHIDHLQPKWAGGADNKSNLRVLCQKHNHHIYREQAKIKYI